MRVKCGGILGGHTYMQLKATDMPMQSPFQTSNCVAYTSVTETRPDGSKVIYSYNGPELTSVFGIMDNQHPMLYDNSLIDIGNRIPLLESRMVIDPSGEKVTEETFSYVTKDHFRTFDTGVRVACEYVLVDIDTGDSSAYGNDILSCGAFEAGRSTARVRYAAVSSRSVTDCGTGFTTTTCYTYDDSMRTTRPMTESVTDSRGRTVTTRYRYPFECNDTMSLWMTDDIQVDNPVSVETYSDGILLSSFATEYGYLNDMYYPVATSSWSMPTSDAAVTVPSVLPERERVSAYNSAGRPLSIRVNGTDETAFTWNDTGDLLLTATAPGGLTTRYAHRPLFGLDTVTSPNGHFVRYGYDDSGRLSHVQDNLGGTETYNYGIVNHPGVGTEEEGNSVTSRRYLTRDGSVRIIDRQFYDGLGRPSVLAKAGMNTTGKYLYSAVTYDKLGRELRSMMPGVGGTDIERKTATEVLSSATSTYDDSNAYSETTYDGLDRPVKVTTPGQAWNDAKKWKTTGYVGNAANSVRYYHAPMTSLSLVEDGYYAASTLQGVRSIDEDGNEMTVYTDRLGRKVLERRGPESGKGQNDTY
ncbi:MAG: DUF6443 domain-containing protein, partial [Muribaculum sp.]|nr:DUF6443 domain-containing protein [Muribaculum sp.]